MVRERFGFKRLVAYGLALDFYGWAVRVAGRLSGGELYLADQLRRAALSMVLNIAEGAGSWRPGNKRKHYATARGSTFEAAALLDALWRTGTITREEFDEQESRLAETGARLTRLCQRYDTGRNA